MSHSRTRSATRLSRPPVLPRSTVSSRQRCLILLFLRLASLCRSLSVSAPLFVFVCACACFATSISSSLLSSPLLYHLPPRQVPSIISFIISRLRFVSASIKFVLRTLYPYFLTCFRTFSMSLHVDTPVLHLHVLFVVLLASSSSPHRRAEHEHLHPAFSAHLLGQPSIFKNRVIVCWAKMS